MSACAHFGDPSNDPLKPSGLVESDSSPPGWAHPECLNRSFGLNVTWEGEPIQSHSKGEKC